MTIYAIAFEPAEFDYHQGASTDFLTSTSTVNLEEAVGTRISYGVSNDSYAVENGLSTNPAIQLSSDITTGWLHARVHNRGTFLPSSNVNVGLCDTAGNFLFGFRRSPTDNDAYGVESTWDGAHALDDTQAGNEVTVDANFSIGVSGFLRVFLNGTLVYNYNGDTSGNTAARYLVFGDSGFDVNSIIHYSQVFVADFNTINSKVYTMPVSAAGTETQWTGTYDLIDDTGEGDSDFIETDTNANESSFDLSVPGSLLSGHVVEEVIVTFRALTEVSSSVSQVQPYLNIGGTSYDIGSAVTPGATASNYEVRLANNPADAAAFEIGDLTGMELGFRALT